MQAVVGEPVKKNMYKGVSLCYSIITIAYITIGITGFWAFGNTVQPFILASLTGPSWAITFANVLLIVQVVGCYQVWASPKDTKSSYQSQFDAIEWVAVQLYTLQTRSAPCNIMAPGVNFYTPLWGRIIGGSAISSSAVYRGSYLAKWVRRQCL